MTFIRSYTDEQLIIAVKESTSWRGVLRHLGLRSTSGSAMRSARYHADRLELDYTHFDSRRWSDDDLREAVAQSRSWEQVVTKLELRGGSSSVLVRGHALRLGLDTSHFLRAIDPAPVEAPIPDLVHLREAGSMLAAAWFTLCGEHVSWPLEPCRYDLLTVADGIFRRVQVKTTTRKVGNTWIAQITTSGRIKTPYDPGDIDDFFIIDGDLNFYLIPIEDVGGMTALQLSSYQHYRLPAFKVLANTA